MFSNRAVLSLVLSLNLLNFFPTSVDGFPGQLIIRSHGRKMKRVNDHAFESGPYYQGDILGFGDHIVQGSDGTTHREVNLWPYANIPYTIDRSYSAKSLKMINGVIEEYNDKTCLNFFKRTNQKKYIHIKNAVNDGCASNIGVLGQENQPQEVDLEEDGCMKKSTIQHELMHAIGFIHEHSRPDRNKYIIVQMENLSNKSLAYNFKIDKQHFIDVGVPYDINSIMQYDSESFAKKPVKKYPTLLTKGRKQIVDAEDFAQSDLKEIERVYKKECDKRFRETGS